MEPQETLAGSDRSLGEEADGFELPPPVVEGDVDKMHTCGLVIHRHYLSPVSGFRAKTEVDVLVGRLDLQLSLNGSSNRLYLKNAYGETLVGILHHGGTKELVILCHGFRSSKESKTIMSITDALTDEKISVFRSDFSGNWESEGSFQYGNYGKEVEDLRAVVLHFVNQRRPVRAIIGHSKGGNVVLLYASQYHDIQVVINISGWLDLKRGIEEQLGKDFMLRIAKDGFIDKMDELGRFMYRITEESLMDRLGTDMLAACLAINFKCRVLTIHGSEDEVVPSEDALEFAKSISNHKLHIIEGADHAYTSHHFQLANILLDFISAGGLGEGQC